MLETIQSLVIWAMLITYFVFLIVVAIKIRKSRTKTTGSPLQAPIEPNCCDNVNVPKSRNYSLPVTGEEACETS